MKAEMILRSKPDGLIARMGNYHHIEKQVENRSISCPVISDHLLLRSKEKIYCESCGVWWHDYE